MSIVGKKKLILTAPTVYATFIIVSLPSLLSANVFELTTPPKKYLRQKQQTTPTPKKRWLADHRKKFEYVDSAEDELFDVIANDFNNADFIPTKQLMLLVGRYGDGKIRNLMENVFNYESGKRGYYNGKRVRGFKKR